MKTLPLFLLITVSLTLLSTSCKKHIVQPVNQLSLLPPATQTGANTFGCLVNGQAFVPKNQNILEGPILQCNYIYTAGGYNFSVEGGNKNSDGAISEIDVGTNNLPISKGENLKLAGSAPNGFAGASYDITGPSGIYNYDTSSDLTGQLTITKLDSVKQIVSGTFSFNVLDHNGDTVKITNGRFDMLYTR